MPDEDALERRLRAVERTLADGDHDLDALREAGDLRDRVERLESTVEDLREQVEDLDAATQALRGYVGNVRSVNRDVERRADAALAAVERLESDGDVTPPSSGRPPTGAAQSSDSSTTPDAPPATESSTDPAVSGTDPDVSSTGPPVQPTSGRDENRESPTASPRESDRVARRTRCPYCSDRTADESASPTAGAPSSRDVTDAGGREAADVSGVTGGTEPTAGSPSEPRSPASRSRREDPAETPATTRTTDGDEEGPLDRIRDLLA